MAFSLAEADEAFLVTCSYLSAVILVERNILKTIIQETTANISNYISILKTQVPDEMVQMEQNDSEDEFNYKKSEKHKYCGQ